MKIISFQVAPNGDIYALMNNGTIWMYQNACWFPLPPLPKD